MNSHVIKDDIIHFKIKIVELNFYDQGKFVNKVYEKKIKESRS